MVSRIEEKLSFTLFLFFCAVATPWQAHCAILLGLLIARSALVPLRPVSEHASRRFWQFFLYFILLSCVMIFVNGMLIPEGPVVARFLSLDLHLAGVMFGLETGTRLLVLIVSLLIFFGSTTIKEIAAFLHGIGLPDQIVMTLLLTLYFLDQIPARIDRVFTAQEARGAPVRSSIPSRIRAFFVILTPLILSSIVESIDRGMALELRGFHSQSSLAFLSKEPGHRTISHLTSLFLLLSLVCVLWIILQRLLPS